ncbi:MAG: hypothetical protein ACOXZS_01930 [Bacilli bacterium]|jgi:hypothetical protein
MRRYFLPILLGSILIGAGIILSVFEFSFFSFVNQLPEHNFEKKVEETYYSISDKDLYIKVLNDNYHVIKDESLFNQAKVTCNYYPNFLTLSKEERKNNNYNILKIRFNVTLDNSLFYKKLFGLISTDLKNKEIHNYLPFFESYVEISVNPNELHKVKVIKY